MSTTKTYDSEQMQAIEAQGGSYLVLAPPGCGKTDILSERVLRARASGVPDEQILCLTFTNRASRGMRDRVRLKLAGEPCNIFVGNVHRYCSHLLWDNNLVSESTAIIDDDEIADLLLAWGPSFFLNNKGNVNRGAITLVEQMDAYFAQRELGHPAGAIFLPSNIFEAHYRIAQTADFDYNRVSQDNIVHYALRFRHYKQENNFITFSDILIKAYEALRHDTTHAFKRYSWIQVDEVQDLNALQMAIIDLLLDTSGDYTAMYLGDEQQAIFSFLGAKLEQLDLLKQRCAGHILTLGTNYRSPQYLLDVFNTYAQHELDVDPAILPHSSGGVEQDKFDLILTGNDTIDDQDKRVSRMIDYYRSKGDNERVALLVPTNAVADRVSHKLDNLGIKHFKISGTDMFKSRDYRALAAFFCVCTNDFNRMAWARLLYGIGALSTTIEAQQFVTRLKRLMMTPSDLFRPQTYLQHFIEAYDTQEIVMFDTETTGLDILHDDIVQIAAFKVRHGQRVDGSDFNIFLHTDRPIPTHLGELVNPLVEAYASNPHYDRAQGLQHFLDYIGDCPLLGHNVNYDYRILQANVERVLHKHVTYQCYDSLHLAKCVNPDLRMYKLAYLIKALGLEGKNSHLADEDIAATKALVDYCYQCSKAMLPLQRQFCDEHADVIERMRPLGEMIDRLQQRLFLSTSVMGRNISDEFRDIHCQLVDKKLIKPLGDKFDIFMQYIDAEWGENEQIHTLYDQICFHVNDMTATINEGDLVNSEGLITDHVFIMTVHKGKGLEFDNVVVLDANDDVYPFFMVNKILRNPQRYSARQVHQAEQERREDARKFYVAISRAKRRLCVSYVETVTPFMQSIATYFFGH